MDTRTPSVDLAVPSPGKEGAHAQRASSVSACRSAFVCCTASASAAPREGSFSAGAASCLDGASPPLSLSFCSRFRGPRTDLAQLKGTMRCCEKRALQRDHLLMGGRSYARQIPHQVGRRTKHIAKPCVAASSGCQVAQVTAAGFEPAPFRKRLEPPP